MIGCGCGSLKGARKEASLLGRLPPSSQRAVAEWSGAGVDGAEWSGADVDGETACASCLRLVCFEKRRAASRPEIIPRSGSTTVSGQTDPDRSAAAAARAASSRADHRDAMIGCRRATRVVRARETSQRFLSTENSRRALVDARPIVFWRVVTIIRMNLMVQSKTTAIGASIDRKMTLKDRQCFY